MGVAFGGVCPGGTTFTGQATAGKVLGRGSADGMVVTERMASDVATSRARGAGEPSGEVPAPPQAGPAAMAETAKAGELRRLLRELRSHVEQSCDYVGEDFAEEERKIHYGETDPRGIYGETSDADAQALEDECIEVARVPWLPRENS